MPAPEYRDIFTEEVRSWTTDATIKYGDWRYIDPTGPHKCHKVYEYRQSDTGRVLVMIEVDLELAGPADDAWRVQTGIPAERWNLLTSRAAA